MHVSVPAEVILDIVFGSEAMLLIQPALPLQITRQVVVLREIKALCQVFSDLFYDFCDLIVV